MKFHGSYAALATPFTAGDRIDEKAYRALIRRQLAGGTAGLVPCGTTGEGSSLSPEEYRLAIELCRDEAGRGRRPARATVIAGVASNLTTEAVELAGRAREAGADALLVLTPYYNKPTQEGLYRHVAAVARAVPLPIIVYNIPGRTAVSIAPATLARLARDFSSVAGVKEASGSIDQASEILALAPRGFSLLSGDDNMTLPLMALGARGVISVVANIAPRAMAGLCRAALSGDLPEARALHLRLFPLVKALFCETNPIPLKAALRLLGGFPERARLPLTPLSTPNRGRLRRELTRFGLL